MLYFSDTQHDWQKSPTSTGKQLPAACHARTKTYVSRKSRDVAFPTFGKCDSLKLFPIAYASCLNSGDLGSLSKLMSTRTDRNCVYTIVGQTMDKEQFLRYCELSNDLYPDCVTYIHRTIAVGNQISAILFFKYTASKMIDKSIRVSYPDKILMTSLHTDPVRLNSFIATQPIEDRPALLTTVYTADELTVRGHGLMTLTVNERTKKIIHFEITCDATDFEPVAMPSPNPVPDVTV